MKFKFILNFLLIFFLTKTSIAQEQTFKVIAKQGNILLDGKPLNIGETLTQKHEIQMPKSAFLSLLHSNGNPLEIKTEGTFEVKKLLKKLATSKNYANKYIDFIQKELTENGGPNAEREKKIYTRKRGQTSCQGMPQLVGMLMPDTKESARFIFGNTFTLKYFLKPNPENFGLKPTELKSYKIIIKDMMDSILYEKESTNNIEVIDLTKGKLADAKDLIVKVVPIKKDGSIIDKTEDVMLSRLDEDEQREVALELANIYDAKAEPTALGFLIEARFFEEKNYLLDAITAYEKVLELSSNLPVFQEMYKCFLIRNYMDKYGFEAVFFGKK
ncbi:MAG: hypothetical protein EAZ97_10490 [Bacteroidetes bacterium]|nr:MAG: hypothetical protein EAZ97_10490 [Bacteroidota bacterium]